jgi:hypothetical protein
LGDFPGDWEKYSNKLVLFLYKYILIKSIFI